MMMGTVWVKRFMHGKKAGIENYYILLFFCKIYNTFWSKYLIYDLCKCTK
jgi:hypothetical protein